MSLIRSYGEMWARNARNIESIPGSRDGGQGIYILYDGSTPVYVGKGNIRRRVKKARSSNRRGQLWDHFSWYVLRDKRLIHDAEALLLRLLPPFLRFLNQQEGHFKGGKKVKQSNNGKTADYITRKVRKERN